MIDKKKLQKCMTALEDMRGLYTMLVQAEVDPARKQEIEVMLQDIERHYQYLNAQLVSLKQSAQ